MESEKKSFQKQSSQEWCGNQRNKRPDFAVVGYATLLGATEKDT